MVTKVRLLSEFIFESLTEGPKKRPKLSRDSVDDQIDSILLKYESDCIISMGSEQMGESLLREADDEKDEDPESKKPEIGKPDEEMAKVSAQVGDKSKQKPDEESDPLTPKIDLRMFCGKVSRLATNYDVLLNMPVAIVNRAKNYLQINYSEALAKQFIEIMENDFGIDVGTNDTSAPRERPIATGAAASGLGG